MTDLERECDAVDELLRILRLDPEQCRTEGGAINMARVRTLLAEQPAPVQCNYPDCKCPFDAPADPNWCARGLPHKPAAPVLTDAEIDAIADKHFTTANNLTQHQWRSFARAVLAAAVPPGHVVVPVEPVEKGSDALEWAVSRWLDEVSNRPLVNVHRRTLDDTWRQVIRHFGGDPDALVGPSHDALLAARPGVK